MNDIFKAKEKLDELLECLIEEYARTKNPEILKLIKDWFDLCLKLGGILNGFKKEEN